MKNNKSGSIFGRVAGPAGFTLVELAIVLVILAILAGIAVPNFMADMPRRRLAKAARNLLSDMERTRGEAVATNRRWKIEFDTANERYEVWDSVDNAYGAGDLLVRTVNLADYGSGVHFGSGAAGEDWDENPVSQRAVVSFTARGTCASGTTYLTNQDNTIAYAVTTSTAGGIRVRMYNGMQPFDKNHWMEK